MNRRSLLALIGFAPIATAAAALPRVADPVKLASTGGREVSANGLFRCESVATPAGARSGIGLSVKALDGSNAAMILTAQSGGPITYSFMADRFTMFESNGRIHLTERKSS